MKTVGKLLAFARDENVTLSKKDISDAKDFALVIWRDRENADES